MVAGIQPTDKSFRYEEIALAARSRSASPVYVCTRAYVYVCVGVNCIDQLDRLSSIPDRKCRSNSRV